MMSRLCRLAGLVAVTAALGGGTAWAQRGNFWTPPPLAEKKAARAAQTPSAASSASRTLVSPLKIAVPAPGALLRGVVEVKAEGLNSSGYVVFRIDNQFAYATVYPFKMRWDTQGAEDGEHVLQVSGYNSNKELAGVANTMVRVQNRILGAIPPGGILLEVRVRQGDTLLKDVEATAEVSGLSAAERLPDDLLGVNGRLYARLNQSVVDINPADLSASIRTTVRSGGLSTEVKEVELREKGYYGMVNLLPTGLALPPSAESKRPRVGLGEISLALPVGPMREGMTWKSPMRVMADLVQRNSYQVRGTHTLDGIWWMKGRKCARISSEYDLGDINLAGSASSQVASAASGGFALELTQMGSAEQGMGGGGGMMGPYGPYGPSMGQPGGPGMTMPGFPQPTAPAPASQVSARLSGLSGSRLTWLDIERGVVVRIEDHISGTLAITGLAAEVLPATTEEESLTTSSLPTEEGGSYGLELTQMGSAEQGMGGGGGMMGPYGPYGPGMPGARTPAGPTATGTRPSQTENPATTQRLPYSFSIVVEIAG